MTEAEKHYYLSGQLFAYDSISRVTENAIKKNGGATTALEIINVFNEMTAHVHYFRQELRAQPQKPTQEALLEAITAINAELGSKLHNVYIFEGGKQL